MTLNFSAKIIVDARDKTRAIYDSVYVDNEYYPENPVNSEIEFNKKITIQIESEHLPHLRANLNSTLRLIQASYDSIQSTDIKSDN
ncbi:MAG: KEOPS complex subunit Pcc1 [Nitrosopumilus sp.]